MTTKDALHRLIDALPEQDVERVFTAVADQLHPAIRAALTAPIDDEPETDEEAAAVDEARRDLAAGNWVRDDELIL